MIRRMAVLTGACLLAAMMTVMLAGCPGEEGGEAGGADGWSVSGAGVADFNGTYTRAGSHNDRTLYENEAGSELWWDGSQWSIGALARGMGVAYRGEAGADLPANPWTPANAAGPAPQVSEPGGG